MHGNFVSLCIISLLGDVSLLWFEVNVLAYLVVSLYSPVKSNVNYLRNCYWQTCNVIHYVCNIGLYFTISGVLSKIHN